MKKTLLLAIFFSGINLFVFSQNLVINPSFENTVSNCANLGGEGFTTDLLDWDDTNSGSDSCSSPDLFSACNVIFGIPSPTNMPNSALGYQVSRTGTRHAGFITYDGIDEYREYIEGHTTSPLVAGETYCVSMYVSLGNSVVWATNNIGVYFTNTLYQHDACPDNSIINVIPQLNCTCTITDTANWVRLQWDYVATGGEEYFTIGNFFNNAGTNVVNNVASLNPYAYYYIDDVSIELNSCCYADITPSGPYCVSDSPLNLIATSGEGATCSATVSGTWSGPGITDAVAGTFDPALAGSGTHTINFTLSCGYVASTEIIVSNCTDLVACIESNGDITVSNGVGTYSWQNQVTTNPCIAGAGFCNGFLTVAGPPVTGWVTYTTGPTITAPTTFPVRVIDGGSNELIITDLGSLPPCSGNPCPTISSSITSQTNVNCFGQSTGGATISASGGVAPYTYTWNPGNLTGATQSNLVAGVYSIDILDDNSCPGSATVTITQPASSPTLNASTITPASCGSSDGAITINATGGTPAYQYSIDNGTTYQSGSAFTALSATTYNIEVKDANGCTVTGTATVTSASAPTLSASTITPASCGSSDGAITINATGGTPAYQYSIDNGVTYQSGSAFTALSATTYNIEVKDANGCTVTGTATVTTSGSVSIDNLAVIAPTCATACDGQITATVSGGTPPYTYQWYDALNNPIGTNTATITGLCDGSYSLSVSEGSGGSSTTVYSEDFNGGAPTWTLNVPVAAEGADPNYFIVNDDEGGVLPPGCGVATNGDATLHVTSVFNPSGGAAYDAGGLCGFLYCPETHRRAESGNISTVGYTGLTLSFDFIANGDIPNDQATVWYNAGLGWTQLGGALFSGTGACAPQGIWTAYSAALPVACENIANLQVAIEWDNNDDGVGSDPSVAVNNLLITTSASGSSCSSTDVATVTAPTSVAITNLAITPPSCGATDGSVTITATGGTGVLNYSIDNGTTTQATTTFSNLASGSLTISVIDANGCQKDSTISIASSNAPTIDNVAPTNPSCGATDGSIVITASGGTGTLNYSIDNGVTFQSSGSFTNLASGSYTIVVQDASGCSSNQNQTLTGGNITITNVATTDPSCGLDNGTITITAIGSGGTYSYSINNGFNYFATSTFNNLGAGTYDIIVKDASGCTATYQVIFNTSTPIQITNLQLVNESCNTSNGSATVTVTGGVVPFSYMIIGQSSQTSNSFTGLAQGTYDFEITDQAGCVLDSNFTILPTPAPTATMPDQSLCATQVQITGTTNISGGVWSANSGDISFVPSPNDPNPMVVSDTTGTYVITFNDAGCNYTYSFNLNFIPYPYTQILDTTICSGESYEIHALELPQNTSYLWNTGATETYITISDEGLYYVTAYNTCGEETDSALIAIQTCEIEVPNVFTPNNDNSNDKFKLVYEVGVDDFSCIIVNRWGNPIREFDDANFEWDGTDKGGNPVAEGIYFYIIKATTYGGTKINKQGFVDLERK